MEEGGSVVSAFLLGLCERLQATVSTSELPTNIKQELQRLLKGLLAIQRSVLEAAEEKPYKSKAVGSWLCELKDVALDADHCLDLLSLNDVSARMEVLVHRHRCPILCCAGISNSDNPAQQLELMIKDIQRRIPRLVKKQPHHLCHQLKSKVGTTRYAMAETAAVFGRDEDKEKLMQLLMSEESSLITIAGRGGVGKTTLANVVYYDQNVASQFKLRMWVTASEIYDTERLLKSIGESAAGYPLLDNLGMDRILDILKRRLAENRFLLVLDDVRNEKLDWEELCKNLQYGLSGSKVIITTQIEEFVSKKRFPSFLHHLKGLSSEDSWSFFRECSCLNQLSSIENVAELEEVGMEIVTKLDGLPLAIRMVGCLLHSNIELDEWQMILNADVWKSNPNELLYGIPAALWLSYQYLPPHIKQCLAYCSVFPRDHKFNKQSLVQMWVAQGLIQAGQGTRMEDLGSEYFDYLLQMSFLQRLSSGDKSDMYELIFYSRTEFSVDYARPKPLDSSEDKYIMHSSIYDLAVFITLNESLCLSSATMPGNSNMKEKKNKKVRHLTIRADNLDMAEISDSNILDNVRTLLFYRTTISSNFDYDVLFSKLKCIRVLCLNDTSLEDLQKSIGNLKLLRYLDLSKTSVAAVPEELCSLSNLQTLKLSDEPPSLQEMPRCMSNLINLRHLKADNCGEIYKLGKLTSLQELKEFIVSNEDGHKIEELKNLTQLHGELCISQLKNVHGEEEAKEAKLSEKEHLMKLELNWSLEHYSWDGHPIESNDAVIEGLKPHTNLKELTIRSNGGAKLPTWLTDGSLSNLETLEIHECQNWDLLLIGQLKILKTFRVEGLPVLRHVGLKNEDDDAQLFPCLRILDMSRCSSLIEIMPLPLTLEAIRLNMVGLFTLPGLQQIKSSTSYSSSLASLHISSCERLTTLRVGLLEHRSQYHLRALHNLVIQDCDELVYLPEHGFSALMSLKTLRIENCPKLRYKPSENDSATLPSSLIEFKVIKSTALINDSFFMSMANLHSLTSIVIKGKPDREEDQFPKHPVLTSLPWELLQHLKSLKQLEIVDCEWLVNLGFQALVTLKSLKISGCPNLTACSSSSDGAPMVLEFMEIDNSSLKMMSLELLSRLTSLHELKIMNCKDLVMFPKEMEGLNCLTSLMRLYIHNCTKLLSLPHDLALIPSLEELFITECSSIQSMPEMGLPASLMILVIKECRRLKQRCKKEGEDWPKISHIFYIEVDGRNVQEETLSDTASADEFLSESALLDWDASF
ncbi:P-loop containing nucleoside triphosphate hydrolase protein [Dioscorea alata]|uniref:P-loop containing nucleoside triphosphate hydrolase protein n=1 Tax=Dioscorea alata TaxID=55571 RepID=A0ACB7VPA8_DIOAL|nr:P-loop containing nucleoside triphosphate hydrolase protein [Dioscorea alata]